MNERIEIRCPGKFRKLFLVLTKEFLPVEGMMMEIACYDCARELRKDGDRVKAVLHYYDTSGTWIKTKETR